jgi:Family of unknown function (DUF5367)
MTQHALNKKQFIISVTYGAVLWFIAAMIVRYIGPMGAFDGTALIVSYALVVPGTVPFILIAQKLIGLEKTQIARSVMIITTTALLLDGIALNFFAGLYGSDPAIVMAGAALIMWGAGVGLLLGLIMGKD